MNCSLNLVLFVVSLCSANNNFMSQKFDVRTKSLEKYCENSKGNVPDGCSRQIQSVESYQVGQLKLEGCNGNIISDAVNTFIYISTVDIRYSKGWTLDRLHFKLDRLKKLNASHNDIRKVSKDFFSQMPELTELDLSHNEINNLEWGSFDRANKLIKIHLSHNYLQDVQPEAIMGLTNLEYIDLSYNRIYTIPEFSSNKKLKSINLEENPISTYDCFHITRMSSVSLQFSWKDFSSFYGNWHCAEKQIQIIRNSESEGVFAPSKGKFELHCNDQSFKTLHEFIAGHRSFTNVAEILQCFSSSIESIDLSSNVVGKLTSTTFERFINLRELSLSDTKLTDFDLNVFKTPNRINLLDISFNNLRHIGNIQLFESFNLLYELKAAGNQLENTQALIPHLRSSVEIIDLSGNFIGKLSSNAFRPLTALKVLNLSDTALSIADYNPFESVKTLLSLDVSHNNLGQVNLAVLSATLNRLEYFYAAHCQIENALNVIEQLGPSLIELNLSENRIRILNAQTLFNLRYLINVHVLDLSYNQLQEIDLGSISNKLEKINLEGNELTQVEKLSRSHFISLKLMAISKNKLSCDLVEEVMREWEGIEFNGDPFIQNHGKNCNAQAQSESGLFTSIYNKIKFW